MPSPAGCSAHLVAGLIENGSLAAEDSQAAVTYLRRHPLDAFGLLARAHTWSDWLRVIIPQRFDALAHELSRTGLPARECLAWLRILFTLVLKRENLDLRNACIDWIGAVPIDDDVRQSLGSAQAMWRSRRTTMSCVGGGSSRWDAWPATTAPSSSALTKPMPMRTARHWPKPSPTRLEFLLAEAPHQPMVVTLRPAAMDRKHPEQLSGRAEAALPRATDQPGGHRFQAGAPLDRAASDSDGDAELPAGAEPQRSLAGRGFPRPLADGGAPCAARRQSALGGRGSRGPPRASAFKDVTAPGAETHRAWIGTLPLQRGDALVAGARSGAGPAQPGRRPA